MSQLELLCPARDAATALEAIRHGADAVYIGAPAFGARAAASNSIDDIARVVSEAHPFGVKVYVTLNTILYDSELAEAKRLIEQLWRIGVDALIVQDMALLEMDLPPIDLHASTQCNARSAEKIRWLSEAGFSQIVLPREFSLQEIRRAAEAAPEARLEVFVHGALCVSYSGDCHAGALLTGRSANRGECPQLCRLSYTLCDSSGRPVAPPDGGNAERYWLSLADMNRLGRLAELIDAGATSFKIEGRLKSASYVKNVTAAYSRALDEIVGASAGRLRRASFGRSAVQFVPDVARSFNRGFTPYFLDGRHGGVNSWRSPKWIGRPVAVVTAITGQRVRIKPLEKINNGDGLGFFDHAGRFVGFRVNRVDSDWLHLAPGSPFPTVGSQLFRNNDTAWEAQMERTDSSRRTLAVDMTLRLLDDGRAALDATDERGCRVTVASDEIFRDIARTDQAGQRRGIMDRLGDTPYRLEKYADACGDVFIPAKSLTALRHRAVEALDRTWRILRRRELRRPCRLSPTALEGISTTFHDNVANCLAEKFYEAHGADVAEKAAELRRPSADKTVMTTRYCLRRELGCCLRTKRGDLLPVELWLKAPVGQLLLEFDCENCEMRVMRK